MNRPRDLVGDRRRPRVAGAPLAITSDGRVVVNVLAAYSSVVAVEPEELVRRANQLGGLVFIGVVLEVSKGRRVVAGLSDAFFEATKVLFQR